MAQLEEGDYRAKAIEGQLSYTQKGTEQIAVRFALLDFPNQTITWFGYFSDAAFEIAMKGLRTAGFKGNDLSDLSSLAEEVSPEVILVVQHEEYKGKVYPRVKFINSVGGLAMKDALQPDQAKSFAERMKGRVLAFDQATGTQPAAAAKPGAPAPRPATYRSASPSSDQPPLDVLDQQAGEQTDDIPF